MQKQWIGVRVRYIVYVCAQMFMRKYLTNVTAHALTVRGYNWNES